MEPYKFIAKFRFTKELYVYINTSIHALIMNLIRIYKVIIERMNEREKER